MCMAPTHTPRCVRAQVYTLMISNSEIMKADEMNFDVLGTNNHQGPITGASQRSAQSMQKIRSAQSSPMGTFTTRAN